MPGNGSNGHLTLHRDAARDAFFPELLGRSLFFDETIKAWVASGAGSCEAMLLSPHLSVSPYQPAYEDMAKRHQDYAFPNLIFAFKYIPMCLNGDDHKIARRGIAEYVAARKGAVSAAAPDIVERRFGALAARDQIELMAEAIEPLVKDVLGTLNQTDEAGRALIRSASAVFAASWTMSSPRFATVSGEASGLTPTRTKRATASRCSSSATTLLPEPWAKVFTGSFSPTGGVF